MYGSWRLGTPARYTNYTFLATYTRDLQGWGWLRHPLDALFYKNHDSWWLRVFSLLKIFFWDHRHHWLWNFFVKHHKKSPKYKHGYVDKFLNPKKNDAYKNDFYYFLSRKYVLTVLFSSKRVLKSWNVMCLKALSK